MLLSSFVMSKSSSKLDCSLLLTALTTSDFPELVLEGTQ